MNAPLCFLDCETTGLSLDDDIWGNARFTAKVDRSGDCWLWTAGLDEKGYGLFRLQGRTRKAHALVFGPVPHDMEIDHTCRVRRCVKPDHLEAVTHLENCHRAALSRATCRKGHPLPEPVIGTRRPCRECAKAADARYRARREAAA